jgi:hypothetical protein
MKHLRGKWTASGLLILLPASLLSFGEPDVQVRDHPHRLPTFARCPGAGDADEAMQIDTDNWVSITAGERPRTRQKMEPFIRRDIASMKPPSGWAATWKPDYQHNGTATGIQVYEIQVNGDNAVVLCLVGSTHAERSIAYLTASGTALMSGIAGSELPRAGSGGCTKS